MPLVEAQCELPPRSINLLHRLDRVTSGLLLATPSTTSSSSTTSSDLSKLFQQSSFSKQQTVLSSLNIQVHKASTATEEVDCKNKVGGSNSDSNPLNNIFMLKTYLARVEGKFPVIENETQFLEATNESDILKKKYFSTAHKCFNDSISLSCVHSHFISNDCDGDGDGVLIVQSNIGMINQHEQQRGSLDTPSSSSSSSCDGKHSYSMFKLIGKYFILCIFVFCSSLL